MRLFIAINFNQQIKDYLYDITQRLKDSSTYGNFTLRENFHLTLVFIGETAQVNNVKQAMDKVSAQPFEIMFKGLGKFRRDGGDIYWIGVEKNPGLSEIYSQLCEELVHSGFTIEKRDYKPHLTLGRQVRPGSGFDKNSFSRTISPMSMEVNKISLMESQRIKGKLTYTEIYTKEL